MTLALAASLALFALSATAQDVTTTDTTITTEPAPAPEGTTDSGTVEPAPGEPAPVDSGTTTDTGTSTGTTEPTDPAVAEPCPPPATDAVATEPVTTDPACVPITDPAYTDTPVEVQLIDPETGMLCLEAECLTTVEEDPLVEPDAAGKVPLCNESSGDADTEKCENNPSRPGFFKDTAESCKENIDSEECRESLESCQELINKGHFSGHPRDELTDKQKDSLDKVIDQCQSLIDRAEAFQAQRARIAAILAARAQRAGARAGAVRGCAALSSFGRLKNIPDEAILFKLRCPYEIASVKVSFDPADEGEIKAAAGRVEDGDPVRGEINDKGKAVIKKLNAPASADVGFRLTLDGEPQAGDTFHIRPKPADPATTLQQVDVTL